MNQALPSRLGPQRTICHNGDSVTHYILVHYLQINFSQSLRKTDFVIPQSEAVIRGKGSVSWYTQGRRLPRSSIHAFSCLCFVDVGEVSGIQQSARSDKGRIDRGVPPAGGDGGSSQCRTVSVAFDCLGERRVGSHGTAGYRTVGLRLLIQDEGG